MAFWKSWYLVEHQCRVAHFPLIDVDEAADFLFGLRALDDFQFADRLDAADPVAQILIRHVQSPLPTRYADWLVADAPLTGDQSPCKRRDHLRLIRERLC